MKVLYDTNVLLDVLLDRAPHAGASARALALAERGAVSGLIGATTVTTLHSLAARAAGPRRAGEMLEGLLRLLEVAPVDGAVIREALSAGGPDFEDAVLAAAASAAGASAIVTRDRKGFRGAGLPVYAPAELPQVMRSLGGES